MVVHILFGEYKSKESHGYYSSDKSFAVNLASYQNPQNYTHCSPD